MLPLSVIFEFCVKEKGCDAVFLPGCILLSCERIVSKIKAYAQVLLYIHDEQFSLCAMQHILRKFFPSTLRRTNNGCVSANTEC